MSRTTDREGSAEELRRRAEEKVARESESAPGLLEWYELRVHQAELEMQNDELRKAQLALQDAHDRYFDLYDLAPVGYLTVDRQSRIREANLTAASLLGVDRSRLIGQALSAFMDEVDADRLYLLGRELPSRSGKHRMEVDLRRGDGSRVPVLLDYVVSLDRGKSAESSLRVAIIDLTDKRRVEEELRDSLLRFRLIAERIEHVFYIADVSTGTTLYASPAFEKLFGRPLQSDEAPLGWLEWIHPADRERVRAALERVGQEGEFDVEYRVVRPDGSTRLVHDRAFPAGEQGWVAGMVRDITEERQVQEELHRAQRMESLGTLASGIAHDFNNLLMGIAGGTSLALKHLEPSHPAYHHIRQTMEATMRGASLTRQLLRFCDQRRPGAKAIELDPVVAGAQALLCRLVEEHIRVTVDTGAPGAMILADPGEIEQILMNLAGNARDAMPGGGELAIRTEVRGGDGGEPGRHVALVVQDTGSGMDEATQARIFEPFFTTKEVGKGTGLGLSTVFGVVKRLGGHLDIDSEVGRGTTFTLYFPIVEQGVAPEAAPVAPARGGETVLVVEDDALVRATVQSYVEALGYRALGAADPAEAVGICDQRGDIDVLLTDIVMPGRFGRDLASELRAAHPGLRVLYMSAHPREELIPLGRLEPSAYLLSKPFDEQTLGQALRRVLDEAGPVALRERGGAHRVLVVDDNIDAAAMLGELLELHGHSVAVAHSGAEALELSDAFRPDTVLCDLALGRGLSGFDVARALRADEHLRDIRLVALTGYEGAGYRARATEAGFDELVTKPIDIDAIEEVL